MSEEYRYRPDATTRPMLLTQIQEALKNRQHVEIVGESLSIRKLLSDLITFERGKAFIPARHSEDYSFQVLENVSFPTSDKMTIENLMRQVLQMFGWPAVNTGGLVQFYFGKMLKELTYDRIIPVILIEHPEVMRDKAYKMLQIISEYTIDRKQVGIPSLVCNTDHFGASTPLGGAAFTVRLRGGVTTTEVYGLIEEILPGKSSCFDASALEWLHEMSTPERMKAKAKELFVYMQSLGLEKADYALIDQWREELTTKRKYAKTDA